MGTAAGKTPVAAGATPALTLKLELKPTAAQIKPFEPVHVLAQVTNVGNSLVRFQSNPVLNLRITGPGDDGSRPYVRPSAIQAAPPPPTEYVLQPDEQVSHSTTVDCDYRWRDVFEEPGRYELRSDVEHAEAARATIEVRALDQAERKVADQVEARKLYLLFTFATAMQVATHQAILPEQAHRLGFPEQRDVREFLTGNPNSDYSHWVRLGQILLKVAETTVNAHLDGENKDAATQLREARQAFSDVANDAQAPEAVRREASLQVVILAAVLGDETAVQSVNDPVAPDGETAVAQARARAQVLQMQQFLSIGK